jgi:hypothetical protein
MNVFGVRFRNTLIVLQCGHFTARIPGGALGSPEGAKITKITPMIPRSASYKQLHRAEVLLLGDGRRDCTEDKHDDNEALKAHKRNLRFQSIMLNQGLRSVGTGRLPMANIVIFGLALDIANRVGQRAALTHRSPPALAHAQLPRAGRAATLPRLSAGLV